jgi:glycosyl-4,4'-diaponeurosporenoate acyltransferase
MAIPSLLPPVLASAGLWLVCSLLIGFLANRLPDRFLRAPASAAGREAACRAGHPPSGGSGWGIHAWKRWIPDAGNALPGGVRKASLVRRDPEALQRLLLETRRAELVHWALWPVWILTALWLPPAGVLINLVFATLFNLPCLLLQRYNRQRLRRCLGRMAGRGPL